MNLPKNHKTKTIYNWKRSGVIYDNMDTLYQYYINCKYCEWCYKVFENTRDRHLDHCHITGSFRLIVCHKCNNHDSYLNYPDGYDKKKYKKEYNKEYSEKNKDKIKARKKEKYVCECGATISRDSKSAHLKSFKHLSNTL